MKMKSKALLAVICAVLLVGATLFGTLAYLTDDTDTITNTFTFGNVEIELDEDTGREYKMIPGQPITKHPFTTVKANSEDCWLFVKVEKSDNFDDFMTFENAAGWTALTGVDDIVYYRAVSTSTSDQVFDILKGTEKTITNEDETTSKVTVDQISVRGTVTGDDFTADDFENPTLAFTAYAIQQAGFTTADLAWAEITNSLS